MTPGADRRGAAPSHPPPPGAPEVRLAVTLGDPRGIGPEIAARAIETFRREVPSVRFTVLGSSPHPIPHGDDRAAGEIAGGAIEEAVALARSGAVDGVVTAPIHKPALHAAGWRFPGHTEMLQELSGVAEVGMLMVAEETLAQAPLRVLLATTHLPLKDVPTRVTSELLVSQSRLLLASLRRDFRFQLPRIALCALNPHASDDGLFGDEEARIYRPALDRLRGDRSFEGCVIAGPIPADTVFRRCMKGEFDAVLAPYHDVGMAAFKTVSFGAGVNVTLGLPFVRTSPDHGTAFDLAGKGTADASSMLEALRLAFRIHRSRFDSPPADA